GILSAFRHHGRSAKKTGHRDCELADPTHPENQMKASLVAGGTATSKLAVDRERTIDFMGEKARVYATPMLVRDIEIACRELLLTHLDPGEDSVGTRIELDHLAPTLMGMPVEIKVTIAEVKGRAITLAFGGRDSVDPI